MPVPVPRCGLRTAAAAPRCGHCGTGVLCVVCAVRTVMTDVCVPPPTTASRRPGLRLAAARSRRSRRLAGAPRERELRYIYARYAYESPAPQPPSKPPHPEPRNTCGEKNGRTPSSSPLACALFRFGMQANFLQTGTPFRFLQRRGFIASGAIFVRAVIVTCTAASRACSLAGRAAATWRAAGRPRQASSCGTGSRPSLASR